MCVRCTGANAPSTIRKVITDPHPSGGRSIARGRLRRPGLARGQAQGLCHPETSSSLPGRAGKPRTTGNVRLPHFLLGNGLAGHDDKADILIASLARLLEPEDL